MTPNSKMAMVNYALISNIPQNNWAHLARISEKSSNFARVKMFNSNKFKKNMKAKLMTIFAILAVMMTIVGCKPDSITEEEEQKVVDEVTIDLTRNDWKSVKVTERIYDGKSYTYTTVNTLCFKNSMVTYNIEESSNYTDDIYTLQREGSYTVSKDGKTVTIIIGKNIYTLNYSKEKLTGFWSSNYLEFLTIQCMN